MMTGLQGHSICLVGSVHEACFLMKSSIHRELFATERSMAGSKILRRTAIRYALTEIFADAYAS